MKSFKNYLLIGLMTMSFAFVGCSDDDVPAAENEEEIINSVTLTFTPAGGGSAIVATYLDADGEGTGNPVLSDIELNTQTTYTLNITMANTLESPAEDITVEVEEEGDEHQLFFGFSSGVFSDPSGTGNIGSTGTINYTDQDDSGNPIGLSTTWITTNQGSTGGEFRVLLKHQPDIKSATSTSSDGETDIDITWTINVSE
ncbi:hypothetical protein [Ekhidna sp.]|uniref:hypothetical protein n=1 Tax=Ekhidna sp. TaxID=2608089 RepID=UPI003298B110